MNYSRHYEVRNENPGGKAFIADLIYFVLC